MAQVANTWDTYDSKRNREQLANDIDLITPEETPLYSMIGTKQLEGTHPEWNLDVLNTPNSANRKIEGDVWSFATPLATSRVGNYTQISDKEFIITDTQEAVSAKAGPKSDVDREMMKAGMELRIDLEVIMLSNQASVAGNNATPRQSAGMRAWIATNDMLGATGASGGFNAGTGIVDAATNGTPRAFTKDALLDAAMSGAYTSGGRVDTVLLSPYAKSVFSKFMSDANVAQQRTTITGRNQATIYAAADTYVGDFGTVVMVPDRQLARAGAGFARNIFGLDRSKWSLGFLRPIHEVPNIPKTSDATPGVLLCEWTLISKNEAANFVIADIFGMTATT
jgi:hypothetical protein